MANEDFEEVDFETDYEESEKVVFDVGGQRFTTTLATIKRYPDSELAALCEECHDTLGTGEDIYIDRNPDGFAWILDIFRDSVRKKLPPNWTLDDIEDELRYYCLPSAVELIPFHGEMLVRMEKAALKKLAGEICKELARVRKDIIFSPFVRFLVWRYISETDKLRAHYINVFDLGTSSKWLKTVADHLACAKGTGKDSCLSYKGRWTDGKIEILSLNATQMSSLSDIMLDLGFKVSNALPEGAPCAFGLASRDASPQAMSFLKVSWEKEFDRNSSGAATSSYSPSG